MSARGISAVIVPDFSGPRTLVFEARTLFFLASWLRARQRGETSLCQVHVCCIGAPPASVQRLAAHAGVGWSVHEPLLTAYGGFANKLRGLEVPVAGERVLLLDADILMVGKLDALGEIAADVAAAPADKPQVPEAQWRVIYDGLGLPVPTERIASVYAERGAAPGNVAHPYEGQSEEAAAMLPYYNSGALLVRPGCGLLPLWEDHLVRIPALLEQTRVTPAHAVTNGDQVALATAFQALRGRGATFAQLPYAFNARLSHFRTGALRVDDTALLHAPGFAGFVQERGELIMAIHSYEERWSQAIRLGLNGDLNACEQDLARAHAFLWSLWERWVREEWERAG